MALFFSILLGLLQLIGEISLFWIFIGFPIGIILSLLKYFHKFQTSKKRIFWWCFGGIIFLIVSLLVFVLVALLQEILHIPYQDNRILSSQNLMSN
jgi:hypothetical protein